MKCRFSRFWILRKTAYSISSDTGQWSEPAVLSRFAGMEIAEGVDEAAVQKLRHLGALLVGEAGVHAVGLWVLEVDFLVRHVHVAAHDHRLRPLKPLQIRAERVLPLHAVGKPLQLVLRIGRVDAHQIKIRKLRRQHAPLVIVRVRADAARHAERLHARENRRARIARLLRRI